MPTRTYFVDHINHCRYPLNGVIPSTSLTTVTAVSRSFRDHIVLSASELPPQVDLRPDMTAVEQQWTANSCVANAYAGAYEYLLNKDTGNKIDVSRLFIYYNARYRGNPWATVTDSGCMLDQAIAALCDYGVCLESIWPYEMPRVNMRPNMHAYQSAQNHKIVDWLRLSINLNEMKTCLAQGYPFTFGAELFPSFGQATQSGIVPMPSDAELDPSRFWDPTRQQQQHRYHAMLVVGYNDQSQVFIVRNSWGSQWGNQGYCYMPYAYLSNSALCFDAWVIRKLATDDFSRDRWSLRSTLNLVKESHPHQPSLQKSAEKWEIIDVEEPGNPEEAASETNVTSDNTKE